MIERIPVRDDLRRFKLSLRLAGRGGPVAPAVIDQDGLQTTGARKLLVLVHGYNNTAAMAQASFDTIIDGLEPLLRGSGVRPDAIVELQWPGDAAVGPLTVMDTVGYPTDIDRARKSAARLADFLAALPAAGPSGPVLILVGHSLGCRLLFEMLDLVRAAGSGTAGIDTLVLMAAAVPTEMIASGGGLDAAAAMPRQVIDLFSESDWVLRLAFPLGQAAAYGLAIEQRAYVEAVGLHGRPADFALPVRTANSHGGYWSDEVVARTITGAIDPTYRPGPAARALPGRSTPAASDLPWRALPAAIWPF